MKSYVAGVTKAGRTIYGQVMTEGEYRQCSEDYCGACVFCGEIAEGGTEPDARRYPCEACEEPGVYGLEELLVRGFVQLEG